MDESKTNQEVIETERRWVQAHRDLDIDVIKEILHENYTQLKSDGSLARKIETVASYASGKRHWEVAQSDQYDVQIFGDIALLIGRWIGRGENSGERFDYTARFMSIYVRTSGGWKLIADQSTPIEAADL